MAKVQGKKSAAKPKSGAKKVAARVKGAVSGAARKVTGRKPATPLKAKAKAPARAKGKPAPKVKAKAKPARSTRPPAKPVRSVATRVKAVAKKVAKVARKVAVKAGKAQRAVVKAVRPAPKVAKSVSRTARPAPKKVVKTAKPAPKAVAKKVSKAVAKAAAKVITKVTPTAKTPAKAAKASSKTAPARPTLVPSAVSPAAAKGPVASKVPAVAAADEKKRTRRPRLRLTSGGAPAASWLTTEKPRAASFIPAPPRAEAPSAIAAAPASSDRLIRPEEVMELAVRTVPVRIDIEQGAGRFYVIANPLEVTLKVGEGIEWDFRYLGGADVNIDDVEVVFERSSPFAQAVFKTRKPGGARPHRQLSGPASAAAIGTRVEYVVKAMSAFKTALASARIAVNVTA